jgi:glycerate 2-kinase
LAGGETTVTVTGEGRGGRNGELALNAAFGLEGLEGVTLSSVGTDGIDGMSDSAGAIIDGSTLERAKAKGLNPLDFLQNNDSHTFFKELGDLIYTGPTGTNVNDVMLVVGLPRQTGRKRRIVES